MQSAMYSPHCKYLNISKREGERERERDGVGVGKGEVRIVFFFFFGRYFKSSHMPRYTVNNFSFRE